MGGLANFCVHVCKLNIFSLGVFMFFMERLQDLLHVCFTRHLVLSHLIFQICLNRIKTDFALCYGFILCCLNWDGRIQC